MITLYAGPLSLFSRKISIALDEKGLRFTEELVPFTQERGYQPIHPAVLANSPKRQVPVLIDDDLVLFDSTVILEYLEDAYPAVPLYPRGAKARARCRLLELAADEILFAPVRDLLYRTEPPHADPAIQARREEVALQSEDHIRRQFGALEPRLGDQAFFCGELSAADIGLFMTIFWVQRLAGPGLEDFPLLLAWYQRLLARPAFARAAAQIAAADRELSPALQRHS
ncbi:MAG TPA: glutathione S-transferase family protein [Terriglobales bacterium]|nr:glutathione S-transferase family protein [Terriglobales bacterium]